MNHKDALARQHSLRDGQTARARLHDGVDRRQIAAVAEEDGVPVRYAKVGRSDLDGPAHAAATKAIDCLVEPLSDFDGLIVLTRTAHYGGRLAGAVYTGAVIRGRAAKWINFPEMADHLKRKISTDSNNEWDVGELAEWNTELDSARYCYDLVVVHNVVIEHLSPYTASELHLLVSARATRGLFTVITTRLADYEHLFDDSPSLGSLIDQQFVKHKEPS